MIHETVEGERFATVAPTPRLARCIAAAAAALERGAPAADVVVGEELRLGPRTTLVPTISLFDGDGERARPSLVVEFRVESTSRYVLGPKRLGYSRNGAPEVWFVDPWRSRVAVLRAEGPEPGYGWPPGERRPGERLPTEALANPLTVDELLAGWPGDVGREPEPGERWWEEA